MLQWKWVCICLFKLVSDSLRPPWTIAHQAPPLMEFSRQEYWSGLPFPSPGDLLDLGIEPRSPALQADALPSELPRKPTLWATYILVSIMATPIYICTNNVQRPFFPHILSNAIFFCLFDNNQSSIYEVVSHYAVNISLVISDVQHLFMY